MYILDIGTITVIVKGEIGIREQQPIFSGAKRSQPVVLWQRLVGDMGYHFGASLLGNGPVRPGVNVWLGTGTVLPGVEWARHNVRNSYFRILRALYGQLR